MGASECETAKNEEIHKRIGLSNKAIKKLIRLQHKVKANNLLAVKKVAVCNFLLETEDITDLFDCLYNYLLGEYYFNDGQQDLSATAIYLKSPLGTSDERLNFAESFSYVFIINFWRFNFIHECDSCLQSINNLDHVFEI